jgi:hypothetical protein
MNLNPRANLPTLFPCHAAAREALAEFLLKRDKESNGTAIPQINCATWRS